MQEQEKGDTDSCHRMENAHDIEIQRNMVEELGRKTQSKEMKIVPLDYPFAYLEYF